MSGLQCSDFNDAGVLSAFTSTAASLLNVNHSALSIGACVDKSASIRKELLVNFASMTYTVGYPFAATASNQATVTAALNSTTFTNTFRVSLLTYATAINNVALIASSQTVSVGSAATALVTVSPTSSPTAGGVTSPSSAAGSDASIIGGAVGGGIAFILVSGAIYYVCTRQSTINYSPATVPQVPFNEQPK